eukprot:TRINITY_DN1504_c0_g1_i1.p1 TRINITY_DN1504_c0_g1~~TRINITY_DN1504_c0_g1_i1.p1  ORF type:complete len:503 (+),score=134.16 TRINITY_DN1504_c0_g1_i1:85-1593(+)
MSRRSLLLFVAGIAAAEASEVWVHYQGLNCYTGYGATDLENPPGSSIGSMPLDQCRVQCMTAKGCTGVAWSPSDQQCYRRTNINIAKCTTKWGAQWDTHVVYRSGAGWSTLTDKNCYDGGHGATKVIGNPQGYQVTNIPQCQQKCAATAGCSSIVVPTDGSNWCWLRGGDINYYNCDACQGKCNTMVMGTPVAPDESTCGAPGRYPCLMGISKVGFGFDAITGTWANRPVVATTFAKQQTFTDPSDNVMYLVPDQVSVTADQSTMVDVESSSFTSEEESRQWAMKQVKISTGILWFKLSTTVTHTREVVQDSKHWGAYAHSHMSVSSYRAALPTPAQLTPTDEFMQAIASLPKAVNSTNLEQFKQFFSAFGTHYVESAAFGGSGEMNTMVAADWASKQTDLKTAISTQCGFHFLWLKAGGSASGSSGSDKSDQDFHDHSSFSEKLVGGQPGIATSLTDWNNWMQSVVQFPEIIQKSVQPISVFISDGATAAAIDTARQQIYG